VLVTIGKIDIYAYIYLLEGNICWLITNNLREMLSIVKERDNFNGNTY
jgi:hypothetical protein